MRATGGSAVHLLGAARTPFGAFGGELRSCTLPRLGAVAVGGALFRAGVEPELVDEVVFGVNFPGSDRSIARQIALLAGIPDDRNSYTIDRACCSSLAAIAAASRSIRLRETHVAAAGGTENLSGVPYYLETTRWGQRLGDMVLKDQLVVRCPHTDEYRAVQAANEASDYGVGREEQDAWALRSQRRYADALAQGWPADEIVAVGVADRQGSTREIVADEVPRPDVTEAMLAGLTTVYGSTSVTAGNAPTLGTGAAAVVLGDDTAARTFGSRAELIGFAAVSGHPARIASIPAVALRLAIKRAGIRLHDVAVIEINEAFAAVPLVTTLALADRDPRCAGELRERTNVNGGAIAIGHPTGATGARLLITAIAELTRRGGGIGAVALCGGIGEAEAIVLRVAEGAP